MERSCMQVAVLLCLMVWTAAVSATQNATVIVSDDVEFQAALMQQQVQHIVLADDIQLQAENWKRADPSRPAVRAKRNITISSKPAYRTIDFAFLASNWIKLASGTQLNISNTVFKQSRYGVGVQLDFVAPSPGAYLVLWNAVVVRHLCVNNVDEPESLSFVPRVPGFPGEQRAHYATTYCLQDTCFDKVIIYDDVTKVATSAVDTAAGGYALVMHNVSKVCKGYAEQCRDSSIAESCMQRAIDALPAAARTPGRTEAEAKAAEAAVAAASEERRQRATLAAAIGAGAGVFLLLVLLVGLLVRHRRQLRKASNKSSTLLPLAKVPGSPGPNKPQGDMAVRDISPTDDLNTLGAYSGKDVQMLVEQEALSSTPTSFSSRPVSHPGGSPAVQAEQMGPPCVQDNWELAAWKTNSHSLRRLSGLHYPQQQQHSAGDLAVSVDGGQLTSPVSVSPFAGAGHSKALSSHELILQGTGVSTSQQLMASNRISLGVCIGAGSFGKVYKGKWRGIDVAVKVVQHSQAAAASVANEIDLMMGFHHPNLVSAYHFVTWRRRKSRLQHHSGDQVLPVARQASLSSGSLSCGNSLHAGGTPEDVAGDEDMQTYIVQEYCDAGNLGNYCIIHGDKQDGQLPTGHAMLRLLFRLREVADGMHFLHETARVVHGDLKSNNILLCVAPTAPYGRIAKVADFGLARVYQAGETHKSTKTLGTVNHSAPEALRYGKVSAAADVYSFGIMAWELLTGQVAFKGWQWGAILEHVALASGRPVIPEEAPEDFVLLMESCWHQDPTKRPTFQEVLRCINIMITSRQQELIEQASGVSTRQHTMTAALTAAAAALHGDDTHSQLSCSHTSAGIIAADMCQPTTSTSSNGEWDLVRIGSMRHVSGASNATSRSSPAPRQGSKALFRSSLQQQPGQLPPRQQQQHQEQTSRDYNQQQQQHGTVSSSFAVVLADQPEGNSYQGQGNLLCPGAVAMTDGGHGPQDL